MTKLDSVVILDMFVLFLCLMFHIFLVF